MQALSAQFLLNMKEKKVKVTKYQKNNFIAVHRRAIYFKKKSAKRPLILLDSKT